MPKTYNRVKETTTTTGTGTVNLGGAVTGYRAFSDAATTGDVVYYCIESEDKTEWEVGSGAVTTGTPWTLARTTIYDSSNSGSAVNFSAGTKSVFSTRPAEADEFMGALVALSSNVTALDASAGYYPAWDTETYDTHGFHNSASNQTRLTIPSGLGINKVRIGFRVRYEVVADNASYGAVIRKNGVDGTGWSAPGMNGHSSNGESADTNQYFTTWSAPLQVVDGDYFELRVASSDTSITLNAAFTWFAIEVVERTG